MRGGSDQVGGRGGAGGGGRLLLVVAAESEAEAVLRGFSPPFGSVPISPSARSALVASSVDVNGGDEGRSALLAGACRAECSPADSSDVVRRGGGSGGGVRGEWGGWRLIRVSDRVDLLVCGVGKGNAAGAVGWCFGLMGGGGVGGEGIGGGMGGGWVGVVSLGIGGALPVLGGDGGEGPAEIGDVVVGSASVYGDEGVVLPVGAGEVGGFGFMSCGEMGFALSGLAGDRAVPPAGWLAALEPMANRVGVIATVSTCSGTDVLAGEIRRRTGAVVEGMEGAAVGLTVFSVGSLLGDGGVGGGGVWGVGFVEVRVVSNTTGDRDRQVWDIGRALGVLREVGPRVVTALIGVIDG